MQVGAAGYYPSTDRRVGFWLNIGTSTAGGAATTSIMQLLVQPIAAAAVIASRGQPPV
jgi:hypothetical protein